MLGPVVLGVAERRVQLVIVHADGRFGIPSQLHGVVKGDDVGGGLVGAGLLFDAPVIAVGPEGHDGLVRVQVRHALVEVGLQPVLPGHRAGRAGLPMVVIGHQHQGVGGALQLGERPVVVVEDGGDPDFQVQRLQRLLGPRDEGRIGGQRLGRHVLEVEHEAGIAVPVGLVDQVADQLLFGSGIEDQGVGHGSVEGRVLGVVHHGDDGRGLGGAGDQRGGFRIGGCDDVAGGVLQRDPLRRHHIQRIDVVVQRLARIFIPADVEAHGQRLDRLAGPGGMGAGDLFPQRLALDPLDGLLVQADQNVGVLQRDGRQVRRQRQGRQKAGDDRSE